VLVKGDRWPRCEPTAGSVGSCDPSFMTSFIADVTYTGSSNPVAFDPCTVSTP